MSRRRGARFQIVQVSTTGYVWRMVCSNGREAGRSIRPLGTVTACFDDLADLRRELHRAVMETQLLPDGERTWVLIVDGEPLVRSLTSYERTWDMSKAYELFCECAAHGQVDPLVMVAGRRTPSASRARQPKRLRESA